MATRRGQGLPLSFIVIAAISALVLVLVLAFTIGGLGGFFRQIIIVGGGEDLSVIQTACRTACDRMQATPDITLEQFKGSDYCRRTFSLDSDNDGNIEPSSIDPGKREVGLNCYWQELAIPCTINGLSQPAESAPGLPPGSCTT